MGQSSAKIKPASRLGVAKGSLCAFAAITDELSQVRTLIDKELSDCSGPVRRLAAQMTVGRGKMLRPGLVLLSGRICGSVTEEHIRAAAVIEMIHNATLLHDDVLDEGESRRGLPTLNRLEGNESAVLLGDFLLSRVFRMCVGLGGRAAEIISMAALRTCEGEIRQMTQRGNPELGETEYIDIITEKSAALFGGACEVGAALAGADETIIKKLADYGQKTGIAFQIIDDVLDLEGDQDRTGKTVGNDLDRNKLTLPLIHLLRTAGKKDRQEIQQMLEQQPAINVNKVVLEKLRQGGCLEYARGRAGEFVEQAITALGEFGESRFKAALVETARFIAGRTA
jgi:octaprenyl-diphosphate synthase